MNTFIRTALALLASAALAPHAWAQAWPTKPVRVVVAFTAGGTTDILARSVGQQLSESSSSRSSSTTSRAPAATSAPRWWSAPLPTATR